MAKPIRVYWDELGDEKQYMIYEQLSEHLWNLDPKEKGRWAEYLQQTFQVWGVNESFIEKASIDGTYLDTDYSPAFFLFGQVKGPVYETKSITKGGKGATFKKENIDALKFCMKRHIPAYVVISKWIYNSGGTITIKYRRKLLSQLLADRADQKRRKAYELKHYGLGYDPYLKGPMFQSIQPDRTQSAGILGSRAVSRLS